MYNYDYDEEENEVFSREGSIFQIDTPDLAKVRKFKENVRKSNKFSIIKESERSDEIMENEFGDSANNADDRELLIDEIQEFYGNELDSDFEKALKKIPEKMLAGLKEAFKTLNENSEILEDYPDLKTAMKYIGKFVGYPYPYPYPGKGPGKYPYPKKVKKSMDWQGVQDLLFGGHIPADDEEIEKSSKSNPFPSIVRGLKIKEEAINELEDEMEQDAFDPDDRSI